MAMEAGTDVQKKYLRAFGLLSPLALELPEVGTPQFPNNWRDINTITISYGHGISVTPVHVVSAVSSLVNGAELEIVASTSGANVSLGRVGAGIVSGDQGPAALLVTTTGTGKFNLDNDVVVAPLAGATRAVKFVGNVELGADVRVATDGGAADAGPIDLSGARLFADAAGRSLVLDSTNAAGSDDVTLGIVDGGPTGGSYLTQLNVQTGGGANFGGDLLLTRDVLLDSSATRTARLSFTGDDLVVAASSVLIDTEQGGDHAGGDVLLSTSSIAAASVDLQLTIDSRGNGTGGNIEFGAVDNAGGTRQYLGSFTARTQTGGTITTYGDIRTDASGAITGGVTLIGDVKLALASGATWTVDTQQDNAGSGADIDLSNANVFAAAAGVDVALSASGYGPGGPGANPTAVGGDILLGSFTPPGGSNRIDDLLF